MTTRAKELFEASVDQVRHGQLRPALGTLLDALATDPIHADSLDAAGRICRMLGAPEDATLFEALSEAPQDAEALYNLGYRLVDQTRPDVAITLFERSLERETDRDRTHAIRRELAFAQYANRDFVDCLRTLGALEAATDLSESELLDVRLLQAEASLYTGRRDLSLHFLGQAEDMVPDDSQRAALDALHALVGRSSHWERPTDEGLRAWHFIQHGGVLLKTAGGYFEDGSRAGRYDMLDLRVDMIAFLVQRLVHLIERLQVEVQVVTPVSDLAAPIAWAISDLAGLDFEASLADRAGRPTLVVAAGAGEYEPLCAGLARHRGDLHLFSLNLDWDRGNLVLPEIVGVLARRTFVPWETRYAMDPTTHEMRELPADGRPAHVIGAEIRAAVDALPDDGGDAREEFEGFYLPLKDELVLGNEDLHPNRRQFTSISPCWTPVGREAMGGDDGGGFGETAGDEPGMPDVPGHGGTH